MREERAVASTEQTWEPAVSGDALWDALCALQGEHFQTSGRGTRAGVDFTFRIRGGEMFVDRKDKSITRASVMAAYRKAVELQGQVSGPKKLGTFGASYLYPVFRRLGLIQNFLS